MKLFTETFAESDPVVALASDEGYAMPLAATIRSAVDNLSSSRKLHVVILGLGISDETKARLEKSWKSSNCSVSWIEVDLTILNGLPIVGHVNEVAYFRMLIPKLLPTHFNRVLYLDSDVIVRGDLGELWDSNLDGKSCLAIQDCAAPFFDSSLALPNYESCGPHLGSTRPIPNYQELGISGHSPYFNSGVLLIDVAAWREANVSENLVDCIHRNRQHGQWWDQYALNVVLASDWQSADPRWNQGSQIYVYHDWRQSPYDPETFCQVRNDPFIIHFTTKHKPWMVSCLHPRRSEFFEYLDRTEWAGLRPHWYRSPSAALDSFRTQLRRARFARRRLQYSIRQCFRQAA